MELAKGAMLGQNIIGEVTESIHKFLIDQYALTEQVPRFEEDLSFVPKDREEVVYIYMYRAAQNPNLRNAKRYRQAPVFVKDDCCRTSSSCLSWQGVIAHMRHCADQDYVESVLLSNRRRNINSRVLFKCFYCCIMMMTCTVPTPFFAILYDTRHDMS